MEIPINRDQNRRLFPRGCVIMSALLIKRSNKQMAIRCSESKATTEMRLLPLAPCSCTESVPRSAPVGATRLPLFEINDRLKANRSRTSTLAQSEVAKSTQSSQHEAGHDEWGIWQPCSTLLAAMCEVVRITSVVSYTFQLGNWLS